MREHEQNGMEARRKELLPHLGGAIHRTKFDPRAPC